MKTLLLSALFIMFLSTAAQDTFKNDTIPLPLPEWSAPKGYSYADHYLLGYDVNSKKEFIADSTSYPEISSPESIEPFIPENLGTDEEIPWNRNFTDLELVENNSSYPASATVKLFIKYPNTNNMYIGSGVMVSKNIVLTAGHCLYDQDLGGWASWIKVVPGYRNGIEPFGHAYASCMYSWHAWTDNENFEWDMGEIVLDWCIGLQSGCYGFGTNTDDFFTSKTFHNYSYPGASPYDGSEMYYRKGNFDETYTETLYFNKKSHGGQSGSGFYYKDANGYRYIYAILSNSNPNRTGCTRITTQKFNYLSELLDKNQACSYSGVEENSNRNNLDFTAYPNPVKDRINISLKDNHGLCKINIYNVLGQVVITETVPCDVNSLSLFLSGLTDGCYIVAASDERSSSSKTFIKSSR